MHASVASERRGGTGNPAGTGAGKWLWPVAGALACLGLGIASGLSSAGGGGAWYQGLEKPPGTPPPWVFGPVWSMLYLMMGVALGRLVDRRAWGAVWVFCAQFALNVAWTPVFFGAHQAGVALGIIAALWVGIVVLIRMARRVDRISAALLVPYLMWVSYATYLNIGFFWLNR
ncbi:MAG: tryptophan-rich sensory protein [Verrucomicrobiaceae bacterium]|nr:MAG: tryptophan-rich sensory protein [Verrucomicrobiaceae bacterium]